VNRVGVIGTLVWDRIWTYDAIRNGAGPVEDWGGIAYSLAAWAAACPAGWEIVPVLRVGEDLHEELDRFLAPLPNLRLDHRLQVVPEPTHRVELRYRDEASRTERLMEGVPPWTWEELEPLVAGLDALYVNFISGFEMELRDAERLRSAFAGPIYTDLHSLFLGRRPDGSRTPRPLPEARRWLRCFDAVQLNEDELALLAGGAGRLRQGAGMAREEGVRLVLVTRGAAGAWYAADPPLPRDPLAWPSHRRAPAPATLNEGHVAPGASATGDPTGCGDVWGATVFAALLSRMPVEEAVRHANAAAARSVELRGTATLWSHLRGAAARAAAVRGER
jgi:sugar/nucleoside kinase (ribokinase family)